MSSEQETCFHCGVQAGETINGKKISHRLDCIFKGPVLWTHFENIGHCGLCGVGYQKQSGGFGYCHHRFNCRHGGEVKLQDCIHHPTQAWNFLSESRSILQLLQIRGVIELYFDDFSKIDLSSEKGWRTFRPGVPSSLKEVKLD